MCYIFLNFFEEIDYLLIRRSLTDYLVIAVFGLECSLKSFTENIFLMLF